MSVTEQIARLIVEGEIARVAACGDLGHLRRDALAAGCSVRLIDAFEAMHDVLHERLTENDLAALYNGMMADVRDGLADLDKKGGG